MSENDSRMVTRRDFLKQSAAFSAGVPVVLAASSIAEVSPTPAAAPAQPGTGKSRVVLVRDTNVHDEKGELRAEVVQEMLDKAIVALTGAGDVGTAWRTLVAPTDIVGIKSNVWRFLPTPSQLERSIVRRLRDIGISADHIAIDDRGVRTNPLFAKATALINVRPLRTHYWSGIGSLIKNYIMFVPNPSDWHGNSCADLGKIWLLPEITGKTRLVILSALTMQFHGKGPHHYDPRYMFNYQGMLVGTDPVAVDTTGLNLVRAKRREFFGEERDLETTPHHIYFADTRHGLGTSNPARIELIRLGSSESALI